MFHVGDTYLLISIPKIKKWLNYHFDFLASLIFSFISLVGHTNAIFKALLQETVSFNYLPLSVQPLKSSPHLKSPSIILIILFSK